MTGEHQQPASEKEEHRLVGTRLREARDLLALTQAQVAGALGIPRTSVQAMEAGQRKVTGLELRRLSRLYRRPVTWLLGEEEHTGEETAALYRATRDLTDEDKDQVLRFAEFLAGKSADRRGSGR